MDLDRAIIGMLKHPNYNREAKDHLKDNIGYFNI